MSGADPRRRRQPAGFTLVEVLVAFAIAALSLGALLSSFSTGLRSVEASGAHVAALLQARSIVDRLGSDIPYEEGETSGTTEEGYAWSLRVRRHEPAAPAQTADDEFRLVPVEVEVAVSAGGDPLVVLKTLRLAALP